MADPIYDYIDSNGVIVPDTSDILAGVEQEYKDAFQRQDLITTPDTPQGVLINAEALSRVAAAKNNAQVGNQINPNVATGVFLDALMALTGMQRTPQTQTIVPGVTLTGVAGTLIPAGSQAQTAAQDIFATLEDVTLDITGNATADFASVIYGPIPCDINALNTIVSGILGWETVDNSVAGVLGQTTQSDQAARALRNNTLAFQGVSLAEAITSALSATQGVTSLFFQENTSAATVTINDIVMVPHSVYACVAGGTDNAVAAALLENKSSGSAWNGNTSVDLVEPASGQTYSVLFDRPEEEQILVKVISPNGNAANIVKAILDYAAGLIQTTDQDGSSGTMPGFVIGADVSPFEIAGAILAENPTYILNSVQVTLASLVNYSTNIIPIGVNQQAAVTAGDITVLSS